MATYRRSANMTFLLVLYLALVVCVIYAQIPKDHVSDAFDELDDTLNLHFFNALDGEPIPNAKVIIGDFGEFATDYTGKAAFPIPEDGVYQVTFSKRGFIKSTFNIEIMVGSLFFNRFSVSPELPLGTVRIVLDWGKNPSDLDAHFKKKNSYHISYHNMRVSDDGEAQLDRDDTSSFGPETITAKQIDQNAVYNYIVHNYTDRNNKNSDTLSKSRASVKVYGGDNELLNVFQIPQDTPGTFWHVFKIVNSELLPVNEVYTNMN